jgi:TPR repeat protein/peptidoglycan hydrolase-like protein with peptidoglycan-binding domain
MSAKRPALLIGGVILVALGATGVWLSRPADTVPRAAKASEASQAAVTATSPPTSIVIPQAAAPPEPTSSDFASAAPPATAPPVAAPAVAAPPAAEAATTTPATSVDWTALAIDELRTRANADEIPAMEEMARRLVQGVGVPKDQQAGAGWLLRAAQHGSAQSAFNVGVMYERGFVVERDSVRAVEWYRKAIGANLPMAKHHLALLLREGKGVQRNGQEAVDLLRSASRQGMAAAMFTLGDIYERGDILPKDPAMALAWYAVTAEFDRQTNRGGDDALAKTAGQRAKALQATLLPGDLERAQQAGQSEFKQIVEALQPTKPRPSLLPSELPPSPLPAPALPPAAFPVPAPAQAMAAPAADSEPDPPGWPKAANDQISVIQQALVELKFLSDKPDGVIGPMTRAAIRTFQRGVGARETGEPTKDVFAALQQAVARRNAAGAQPAPATIDLGAPEPPPAPPTSADIARTAPEPNTKIEATTEAKIEPPAEPAKVEPASAAPEKIDPPKPPMPSVEAATPAPPPVVAAPEQPKPAPPATAIDLGQPEPPPAPPTSDDIARADADAWPASTVDQVTAIQRLLRDLNFSRDPADGIYGPATRAAIVDFERTAGLAQTGEPSKALFESLKDMRSTMLRKSPPSP